jgi:hypothetical protein
LRDFKPDQSKDILFKFEKFLAQSFKSFINTRRFLFCNWFNVGLILSLFAESRKFFPWRTDVKFTELLGKLQWFADDTLDFVVVADFNIAGQWEILAERVAGESVVRQNASHVWMVGEEDAEHVPGFPFVPVGAFEHWRN